MFNNSYLIQYTFLSKVQGNKKPLDLLLSTIKRLVFLGVGSPFLNLPLS